MDKKKTEKKKKAKVIRPPVQTVQITPRQEAFCVLVAGGITAKDAYEEAFSCKNWKDQSIREAASKLRRQEPTRSRIRVIILERYSGIMMDQEERIKALNDVIIYGKTADALKAIDIINKMDGSYVQKIEVKETAQITVYLPQKRLPDGV